MLGSPRLRPHPGLRQLGRGHLAADLHRAGPVGSKEDQQCSHCKSTPCLRVAASPRVCPSLLREGQERRHCCAVCHRRAAEQNTIGRAGLRLFAPKPDRGYIQGGQAAPALFSPGRRWHWFLQVREGRGTGRVAAVACLSATLAVHTAS